MSRGWDHASNPIRVAFVAEHCIRLVQALARRLATVVRRPWPDRPVAVADSRFNEQHGDFSPDARWVAYESDESGRSEIYVQSFPGRDVHVRVTVGGGFEPRWSGDGRTVYFISLDGRLMSVPMTFSKRPEAGTATALFPILLSPGADSTNRYRVSHGGQRFLVFSDAGVETPTTTVTVNWVAALK